MRRSFQRNTFNIKPFNYGLNSLSSIGTEDEEDYLGFAPMDKPVDGFQRSSLTKYQTWMQKMLERTGGDLNPSINKTKGLPPNYSGMATPNRNGGYTPLPGKENYPEARIPRHNGFLPPGYSPNTSLYKGAAERFDREYRTPVAKKKYTNLTAAFPDPKL